MAVNASPNSNIDVRLPVTPEQVDDPKAFREFMILYDAVRNLQAASAGRLGTSESNIISQAALIAGLTTPQVTYISSAGFNGIFLIAGGELYYANGTGSTNGAYMNPLGGGNSYPAALSVSTGWTRVALPAGASAVIKILVTGEDVLVLCSNGNLYGWGLNSIGNLGMGSTASITVPTLSTTGVLDLWGCGDGSFSLNNITAFIKKSTGIYGCGYNGYGNIGDNTTVNKSSWTLIASLGLNISNMWVCGNGRSTSFAWDSVAQKLYAWGYNQVGTMGDGTFVDKYVPTDVTTNWGLGGGITPVKICWGTDYTTPATGISQGANTALLLSSDGKVRTCGYNAFNAIGNGNTTNQSTPYLAWNASISPAKELTVHGIGTVFLITQSRALYYWGYNGVYNFSNGVATNVASPTLYAGVTVDTALCVNTNSHASGYYTQQFFGRTDSDVVISIGYNDTAGYLGAGITTQPTTPVSVLLPIGEKLTMIGSFSTSTYGHTFVGVSNKNRVYAWGYNGNNSIHLADATNHLSPTSIRHPATY